LNKSCAPLICLLIALFLAFAPERAKAQGLSFIRDAEIEDTLRIYSTPIFQAAGLSPGGIRIFLVEDKTLNAFVAGGQNMFLFTGLLVTAEDPLEVIGVMAHEAGHIAGGHTATRTQQIESASKAALLSYVLGLGLGIATGELGLGAAAISAGQDVAIKGLLRFTRSQESSADQAAVTYLKATRQSPRGLVDFMETLSGQEALLSSSQDPYVRTHPLSRDRISFYRRALEDSPYSDEPTPKDLRELHDRMVAKLRGYLDPLRQVLKHYPKSDQSIAARYARTIATYRAKDYKSALRQMKGLLAAEPKNPYFHELLGQILFEYGRLEEALPAYEMAIAALPRESTIHLALARVFIELNRPAYDVEAHKHLRIVVQEEPSNSFAWRLLATVYGRQDNLAMTALALAESNLARGRNREALANAKKAQQLLKNNTASWIQAQDVELAAQHRIEEQDN
jgi:predicted Zn-dependent protease